MKKKLLFFLRLFVGAGILFVLFKKVPYQDLVIQLKKINLSLLSVSFIIYVSMLFLGILRWKISLACLDIRIKYVNLLLPFFCGMFFNLLFPSLIAQDVFRGAALGISAKKSFKKIAASLVIDRSVGFFTVSIVAIAAFVLGRYLIDDWRVYLAVCLFCLVIIFLSLFIFSKKFFGLCLLLCSKFPSFRKKAEEFHDDLYVFKKNPRFLFRVFLPALGIQLLLPLTSYIVALSLGIKIHLHYFYIFVPIILTIAAIPITIAGLGLREKFSMMFFSQIGVAESAAFGLALINFFFILIVGILGGILYVTFYSRRLQSNQ